MELGDKIEVSLFRFDPSRDDKPSYEAYKVTYRSRMRVLGALEFIAEELGVEFAFRYYCGSNRCGTCGVKVNGVPVLACWEPVQPRMVIEPLDNLKIVKDLVVDLDAIKESIERLNPRMVRIKPYPGFPENVTHEEMIHVFKLMDCIECGLCTSACPAVSLVGQKEFAGPVAYVKLAMKVLDPRDDGERADLIVDNGIFKCTSCLRCGEVCPQAVDPFGDAIEPLKRLSVAEEVYRRSRAFTSFEEAITESGDIDPVTLMRKVKGLKVVADLPRGLRMLARGTLPLKQSVNPGLDEIKKTIEAVKRKNEV